MIHFNSTKQTDISITDAFLPKAAVCALLLCAASSVACSSDNGSEPGAPPDGGTDASAQDATIEADDATHEASPQDAPLDTALDGAEEAGDTGTDVACACPDDGDPCTTDACEQGICEHTPAPNGLSCPSGKCWQGACCAGCWDQGDAVCRDGTAIDTCGKAGSACADCDDGNECTQDECTLGACKHAPLTGQTCTGGVCDKGVCVCGALGQTCCPGSKPCSSPMAACVAGTCETCIDTVVAGSSHSCVRRVNGTASCWGSNGGGQLGNGTTVTTGSPVSVQSPEPIAQLEAGQSSTCMVAEGGTAYCWGGNAYGQLGTGSTAAVNVPHAVSNLTGTSRISTGMGHSCAVAGGQVYCWGDNLYGRLGTGPGSPSTTTPAMTDGLNDGIDVAAGNYHSCAIRLGGALFCWGDNATGGVGESSQQKIKFYSPVQVSGMTTGVQRVSAGDGHTCAILDTGDLYCWGYNGTGQVGIGSTEIQMLPKKVWGVSGGAIDVSCGSFRTCAIATDGTARCWGANTFGSAGVGSSADYITSPTSVQGLPTTARRIAVGYNHTCALLTDGTVWCWGDNMSGQLGQGHKDIVLDGVPRKVLGLTCQ